MKSTITPTSCLFRCASLMLVVGFAALVGSSSQAQTCNFYVGPNGNDTSSNQLTPTANMFSTTQFATLQAAADYLRIKAPALGVGQHPLHRLRLLGYLLGGRRESHLQQPNVACRQQEHQQLRFVSYPAGSNAGWNQR